MNECFSTVALIQAADDGRLEIVQALLEVTGEDAGRETALLGALDKGHKAVAQVLIAHVDPERVRGLIGGEDRLALFDEAWARYQANKDREELTSSTANFPGGVAKQSKERARL